MTIDNDIRDCADHRGEIRVQGDSLRAECLRLVRAGLLVQLGYRVFSLPDGG